MANKIGQNDQMVRQPMIQSIDDVTQNNQSDEGMAPVTETHTSTSQSASGSLNGCEETDFFHRLWYDEDGQDIIEYGLLAAFISIVALLAIKLVGTLIVPLFQKVKNVF